MRNISVYERAVSIGNYVVETKSTVRKAAKEFSISKSTVYKDITERLKIEDPVLQKEVEKVLAYNKADRCRRGGLATKRKYLGM